MNSDNSSDQPAGGGPDNPALASTEANEAVVGPLSAAGASEGPPVVRDTRDLTPVSADPYDMGATQAMSPVTGASPPSPVVEVDAGAAVVPPVAPEWDDSKLGGEDSVWGEPVAGPPTDTPLPYAAAQVAELPPELLAEAGAAEVVPESVALVAPVDPMGGVEAGKTMALIAHAGNLFGVPTFLIPLLTRDNAYSLFHAKQAAAGFGLFWLIGTISGVLGAVTCVGFLLFVLSPVPGIIGLVWAYSGKRARFPVVGEIVESILEGVTIKDEGPDHAGA